MRRAAAVFAACACAALIAAPAAQPYPPHNCGRETVKGTTVIVQTHGPSCGTALKGVRRWMVHHKAPTHFVCRSYAGDEPAFCKDRHNKFRYFLATTAS